MHTGDQISVLKISDETTLKNDLKNIIESDDDIGFIVIKKL